MENCPYRKYLKLIQWEENFSKMTHNNLNNMENAVKQASVHVDAIEHIRRIRKVWASPEMLEEARVQSIMALKIYMTEEDVQQIVEAFTVYPVLGKMQKVSIQMVTDTQEVMTVLDIEITKQTAQSMVDEMAYTNPEWLKAMTLNGLIE